MWSNSSQPPIEAGEFLLDKVKQIDKNFFALIESALDSRKPSLYENIINWILILLNLYETKERNDKKESLLKYLMAKHSTKKSFYSKIE